MEPSRLSYSVDTFGDVGKDGECNSRRKGKAKPGRESSPYSCTRHPQRNTHLAAGGARQELAQSKQVCIILLAYPFAADHNLLSEIAQMSDRATKGGQAQSRKDEQHFPKRSRRSRARGILTVFRFVKRRVFLWERLLFRCVSHFLQSHL